MAEKFRSSKSLNMKIYSDTLSKESNNKTRISLLQAYLLIVIYSDMYPENRGKSKNIILSHFTYPDSNSNIRDKWIMSSKKTYTNFMNICSNKNITDIKSLENLAISEIESIVGTADFKESFEKIIVMEGIPTLYKLFRRYDKTKKSFIYKMKYECNIDKKILDWCSCFTEINMVN